MKLNEYGIFEYAKNGHSLGALVPAANFIWSGSFGRPLSSADRDSFLAGQLTVLEGRKRRPVVISSSSCRKYVLPHCLESFLFNHVVDWMAAMVRYFQEIPISQGSLAHKETPHASLSRGV